MTHAATQHGIESAIAKLNKSRSYEDLGAVVADTAIVHAMAERINKLVEALEQIHDYPAHSYQEFTKFAVETSEAFLTDYRGTKE